MQLKEKEILLNDHRVCTLRSLESQDAKALIGQLRQVSGETRFMLREAQEITMTISQEQAVLQNAREKEDSVMLGVFAGGRLIANCGFSPVSSYQRMRHRASMGISVISEWWNLGIGTAMMQELIALARQAGYEQLELSVTGANDRARALYQKVGFTECGRIPQAFCYRDGSYDDEVLMIKHLSSKFLQRSGSNRQRIYNE